jgi:hypothetical protein
MHKFIIYNIKALLIQAVCRSKRNTLLVRGFPLPPPQLRFLSQKRRVRAALGQVVQPKPTSPYKIREAGSSGQCAWL